MVENDKDQAGQRPEAGGQGIRRKIAPRLTVGAKFIGLVVLVALLSGSVVGYSLINTSRNSLRQQVLHNNLSQADLAASFASNYIKAVQAHIQVFANRPDIRQAVLNNTPEQIQPELAQFVEIQTALDSSGIYDSSGIQRALNIVNATTIGQSFSDREWFQQTAAAKQPYLGNALQSRATGHSVVPYAIPILDEHGQLRGVLTGSISLTELSNAIVNIGYGSDTVASLVDIRDSGLIIANINPQLLLTPITDKSEAISRALTGERGAIEAANNQGQMELTGFAPVTGLPWTVTVTTPSQAALSTVNALTRNAGLITAFIILLAAIAGIFLVIGVTRPLRRLVEDTKEIGRGNLDHKIATAGRDEIGDLARAFDNMTEELKQTLVSRDDLIKEAAERKRAQEELNKTLAELKRSNEELERFAYVASHDLQEPLRMVASYVQLLERRYKDKLDLDANDFINFAVDGAGRMQNLINDLLAYSRVGSRAKPWQPVKLEEALQVALTNLEVAIQESGAEVTHGPLPIVMADEGQIIQVFQNLISNALKFHGNETPRVHISAQHKDTAWIICVADNGIGIEPQYFDRIFVIFQRLHGQEYPGTGAGLSIAKRIVERHGGHIWVESQPGRGSKFYFSLPEKGEPQR
jgi:signal transduction histidine kinase